MSYTRHVTRSEVMALTMASKPSPLLSMSSEGRLRALVREVCHTELEKITGRADYNGYDVEVKDSKKEQIEKGLQESHTRYLNQLPTVSLTLIECNQIFSKYGIGSFSELSLEPLKAAFVGAFAKPNLDIILGSITIKDDKVILQIGDPFNAPKKAGAKLSEILLSMAPQPLFPKQKEKKVEVKEEETEDKKTDSKIEIKETILLREKNRYDYFYLDAKGNLHCLLPLTGGSTIGIHNTCQTLSELRNFFDEENPNCIGKVINCYLADLNFDIRQLRDGIGKNLNPSEEVQATLKEKIARCKQLVAYQDIIQTAISKFKNIGFTYPAEILQFFNNESHPENNLISISLRPANIDPVVAVPVKNEQKEFKKEKSYPLCSFNRYGDSVVLSLKEKLNELKDEVIQNPARKKEKSLKEKFNEEAVKKYLELNDSKNEDKETIAEQTDFLKLAQAMRYAAKTVLFPELGAEQADREADKLLSKTFSNVSYVPTFVVGDKPKEIKGGPFYIKPGQDGSLIYSVVSLTGEIIVDQEIKKSELQEQLKHRYDAFFAALSEQNLKKFTPFLEDILQITSKKKHTLSSAKKEIDLAYLKDLTSTEEDEGIELKFAIEYWIDSTITPDVFVSKEAGQSAVFKSVQQHQLATDPFSVIDKDANSERELISIRVQFLLAMINTYCCINDKNSHDFGQIIENDPALQRCDLLSMSSEPEKKKLDELKIQSNAAYVRVWNPNEKIDKLFYANKAKNECTQILDKEQTEKLDQFDVIANARSEAVPLTKKQLESITSLRGHTSLQQALLTSVVEAIKKDPPDDITGAIFEFFNKNHKEFHVAEPLSSIKQAQIRNMFRDLFGSIKGSHHYDEFILLLNCPGSSFSLNNRISIHVGEILKLDEFRDLYKKYCQICVEAEEPISNSSSATKETLPLIPCNIVLPEKKEDLTEETYVLKPIPSKLQTTVEAYIVLDEKPLNGAGIDDLATKLTSKKASDGSIWAFDLSNEIREKLKKRAEWGAILSAVLLKLPDKYFELFVQKWGIELNVMPVSPQTATNIYHHQGRNMGGFYVAQEPGPALLKKAMQALLDEKNIEAKIAEVEQDKVTGVYTTRYESIDPKLYKSISSILGELQNNFYISRIMTRALYAEVTARHPEKKLNENDLFSDAIETLFPNLPKADFRTNGYDGYYSSNASAELREQVQAIYQAYYLNLPTVELTEEDYEIICEKTGIPIDKSQDDDICVRNLLAAFGFSRSNVVFESIRLVRDKQGKKKFKIALEDDTQSPGYIVKKITENEAKHLNFDSVSSNTLYVYITEHDQAVHILERGQNEIKKKTFDKKEPNNPYLHNALQNLYNGKGGGVGLVVNCANKLPRTGICRLEAILGKPLKKVTNLHMQPSASYASATAIAPMDFSTTFTATEPTSSLKLNVPLAVIDSSSVSLASTEENENSLFSHDAQLLPQPQKEEKKNELTTGSSFLSLSSSITPTAIPTKKSEDFNENKENSQGSYDNNEHKSQSNQVVVNPSRETAVIPTDFDWIGEFRKKYEHDYDNTCFHKSNIKYQTAKGSEILFHAKDYIFFKNRTTKILEQMRVNLETGVRMKA